MEASQTEKGDMAGNLQTWSWISLSIGSVLGSMISGYVLNHFGPHGVFFVSAIGPVIVLLLSLRLPEEQYHPNKAFLHTVRDQVTTLAKVIVNPLCWRPMFWLFLSNALPPSLGEAMFNFKVVELGFTKAFLGFLSTIGSLTLLCSTAAYSAYFKEYPFRRLFFRVQLASAAISMMEFILVMRANVKINISDNYFIFGDEILTDVVARLKHMPSLVLCAKICPPGVEGTMFALLMSIYNFSWSVSSFGGSWLCTSLNITKTNFSGLPKAVIIRSIAKVLPLGLLFLIPASTTIHTGEESKNCEEENVEKEAMLDKKEEEIEVVVK